MAHSGARPKRSLHTPWEDVRRTRGKFLAQPHPAGLWGRGVNLHLSKNLAILASEPDDLEGEIEKDQVKVEVEVKLKANKRVS